MVTSCECRIDCIAGSLGSALKPIVARALSIVQIALRKTLPSLPCRLSTTAPSSICLRSRPTSRGEPMRNSSSAAFMPSSGAGLVCMASPWNASVRLGRGRSVQGLRPAGQDVVEVLEPRLGELADLGVVEQDALHQSRLQLRLVGRQRMLGGGALQLRDQHRARALELDDLVPLAAARGLEHVLARLLD